MKIRMAGLALLTLALAAGVALGTEASGKKRPTGSINGRVYDAVTKSPVVGSTVMIVGTQMGAATDTAGAFVIRNVPVGGYALTFSSVGHESLSRTDVIVRSKRRTFLDVELQPKTTEIGGITVKGSYFREQEDQPTSSTGFTGEEVRRAPGTAGDVSRIVSVLPSVAKVNDQMNSLIVRGGTPSENAFYLDNIEIPNINHYPLEGSSGGPIGLLNVDFVDNVTFSAGGFPATYGDRLSAVMDLKFREGDHEEFDGQVDMNFAGFGLVGEGPLGSKRGSWLLSVRRSFLDLLVDAIGTGVAPRYSDYQGKLVYDLSPSDKLEVLGVYGNDAIDFGKQRSLDDSVNFYGAYRGYEGAAGVNWRRLWGKRGYSNTSLSHLFTKYDGEFFETWSDDRLTSENSLLQAIQLRSVNVLLFNSADYVEFGLEGKYKVDDYYIDVVEYTNIAGDTVPPLLLDRRVKSPQAGGWVSLVAHPINRLSTTLGLRYDYLDFNEHGHLSPRFAFSYRLSERTSLNGATGLYYQYLPLALLAHKEQYRKLKDPMAYHYVLGVSHLLSENTRLTVEAYYKLYKNFPLDPDLPEYFVVDELVAQGYFSNRQELLDVGRAESYGIELTMQKKLVEGTYGLVSGSFFRSRYRGLDGLWRDRIHDNRFVGSIEGGYKPNNKWEFSIRWILAGGSPYTPLNIEASTFLNRSVYDSDHVNDSRNPAYHSLNVRLDRRFHFSGSSLITYFSVWNVYNRENIATRYWNQISREPDELYQWSLLPVFGLEFEF